jgi:exopolyphosphatase/guanosine-5'-triphosphate,3'-diphosphate pyrophosphatase
MRAVVDIGSNSVKFLAGELSRGAPSIHSSASSVTRLAEKMSDDHPFLSDGALDRTKKALGSFAKKLQGMDITVVATAAARRAKNADQLAQIVQDTLGVPMRIISGSEEAELSRRGASLAAAAVFPKERDFGFIDMGGASTEISFSDKSGPKHSFPSGAVIFLERLGLTQIPASDETWAQARQGISSFFQGADFSRLRDFARKGQRQWIAVGGTLMIAAKIAASSKMKSLYGVLARKDELTALNERVRKMPVEARLQLEGMEKGREDILCGGLLALEFLLTEFQSHSVFITGWGLRHGILFGSEALS